jgi:shikimate kinase
MCSGKSGTGRALAKIAGMHHLDADSRIEKRTGMKVRTIFSQKGEKGFRRLEKAEISSACKEKNSVLSCGGGAVLDPANVSALKDSGTRVWLWVTPQTVLARMEKGKAGAKRPLLAGKGGSAVEKLLKARMPKYAAASDFVISSEGKTLLGVARMIAHETHRDS